MSRNNAVATQAKRTTVDAKSAVVDLVATQPRRAWRTSELVRALDAFPVLEVVMAVGALHREGGLERTGVASYRLPTTTPGRTAERNHRQMWGESA